MGTFHQHLCTAVSAVGFPITLLDNVFIESSFVADFSRDVHFHSLHGF